MRNHLHFGINWQVSRNTQLAVVRRSAADRHVRPKGVVLGHWGFANYTLLEQHMTGMTQSDRVLQTQTLSFIAGFHECFRALVSGSTLVLANKPVALLGPDLPHWIDRQRITFFKAVPSLLRTMVTKGGSAPPMHTLRVLHVGGEPVTQDLVDYFEAQHRTFYNTFGASHTASMMEERLCSDPVFRPHGGEQQLHGLRVSSWQTSAARQTAANIPRPHPRQQPARSQSRRRVRRDLCRRSR